MNADHTTSSTRPGLLPTLNRAVNAFGVHSLFHAMDAFGKMSLRDDEAEDVSDVRVVRDLAYGEHAAQRLDVWMPTEAAPAEGRPCAMFVHGGGFTTMSRRTHWAFARVLARRGWVVFSIDYRLAPEHAFPTPVQDAALAMEWVVANAARYGADTSRFALYGESAGANLCVSLAIACSYKREESWARRLYDVGVVPKAVLPMCGLLQVSDPERYARMASVPKLHAKVLADACAAYLPEAPTMATELADPLLVLERGEQPERPLPSFFAAVGTKDVLRDDTQRLEHALRRLKVDVRSRYYRGEGHSFMAFMWKEHAQRFWRYALTFLDAHVAPAEVVQTAQRRDRMGA